MFLVSATKLSPVCRPSVAGIAGYKGIQVDRDIHEYYVAEISRHTGWRKKTGPPYLIANILKIHNRIAWKFVNFCNIIC